MKLVPHNLPIQLTRFIGRQRERDKITRVLTETRLLTLTGPGGCGKTRLALQIADRVKDGFPDGVWWVELAPLRESGLVPQLIAQTLGVPRVREQPALESLLNFIRSKRMLLVLDNCEHLISECAQLAQQILSQTTEFQILTTSREPLAVAGEALYSVAGLAYPLVEEKTAENPQDLMGYDAVRLFVERARAVLPDFRITAANASEVIQICRRLDGLPLALELASVRSNVLTLQQIVERLTDRFTLLISRQRAESDPRHHTLRATIDWSHDLLSTPEQALLRRLSVFAGGCSLATAEAVCAGGEVEPGQALEWLSSLVNKSLVMAQTLQRGEARYSLLETIRQYAQEKLSASDERSATHDRHLQFFLRLAEETVTKLSGEYQQLWLNWLEGEHDNIRAALAWSLESQNVEAGLRIANAIYQFWTIRDYVEEGLSWVERLLAHVDEGISPLARANALANAVFLAGFRGKPDAQIRYGQEAALLAESIGDEDKAALRWALDGHGYAARSAGDHQAEFSAYQRMVQLSRESGDSHQLGMDLSFTSFSAMSLGKYEEARALLDESLSLLRETRNPYRIAMALNYSGDLARLEQNYTHAQTAYEESISLLREIGAERALASALHNLGYACLHLGEVERAHALFSESLAAQQAHHNTPGVAECLMGFAALAAVCGLPAPGARLLTAALTIGGEGVATAWEATRMEYEHTLALIRDRLTEAEFEAEQAAGRDFSLEQAVEYAQNLPRKSASPPAGRAKPDDLTLREREVATLIALGKSNGEIADELVLSKRTVESHIANILSKLGVTNRAQIVRWALESGRGSQANR